MNVWKRHDNDDSRHWHARILRKVILQIQSGPTYFILLSSIALLFACRDYRVLSCSRTNLRRCPHFSWYFVVRPQALPCDILIRFDLVSYSVAANKHPRDYAWWNKLVYITVLVLATPVSPVIDIELVADQALKASLRRLFTTKKAPTLIYMLLNSISTPRRPAAPAIQS